MAVGEHQEEEIRQRTYGKDIRVPIHDALWLLANYDGTKRPIVLLDQDKYDGLTKQTRDKDTLYAIRASGDAAIRYVDGDETIEIPKIYPPGVFDETKVDVQQLDLGTMTPAPIPPNHFNNIAEAVEYLRSQSSLSGYQVHIGKLCGITTIPNGAFNYSLKNLKKIDIPDTITYIGSDACHSSGLIEVTIPSSVINIGVYAFAQCSDLVSVMLPDTITEIPNYAFFACSKLSNINLDHITSIGQFAFEMCDGLIDITLSIDLVNISAGAFYRCANLQTVTIPQNFDAPKPLVIGAQAFYQCTNLASVSQTHGTVSIGGYAFEDCNIGPQFNVMSTVTSIGTSAFSGCKALERIIMIGKKEGAISGAPWDAPNAEVIWTG